MFVSLFEGNAEWDRHKCLLCGISSLGILWNVESQRDNSDGSVNTHWHWHDIKTYIFRKVLEIIPSDSLFPVSFLASFYHVCILLLMQHLFSIFPPMSHPALEDHSFLSYKWIFWSHGNKGRGVPSWWRKTWIFQLSKMFQSFVSMLIPLKAKDKKKRKRYLFGRTKPPPLL